MGWLDEEIEEEEGEDEQFIKVEPKQMSNALIIIAALLLAMAIAMIIQKYGGI